MIVRATQRDMLALAASRRAASRRGLLGGTAKLTGGGALALMTAGLPISANLRSAAAQTQVDVSTPEGVLNYALTFERLELAFYEEGLGLLSAEDFVDAGFVEEVYENLELIRDQETTHVEDISTAVSDLGGEPVEEAEYFFDYADATGFLAIAQQLANVGTDAYTGAAQYLIDDDELLTTALTIHGVEARHAAYLNGLNGVSPFPDAFDVGLLPDEVLALATPFIVAPQATPDATPTG